MEIPYRIRKSKNRKTVEIRILDSGEVLVAAPSFVDEKRIKEFVETKKGWILEKLSLNQKRREQREYLKGYLHCLGKAYRKEILMTEGEEGVFLEGDWAQIFLHREENEETVTLGFYEKQGERVIQKLQEKWYDKFFSHPEWIRFKKQRSVWGTCTAKNRIYLNQGLLKASFPVIEYVFIHEMCHLKVKDHSKRFWQEVGRYCPNYKEAERYLKEHRLELIF